MDQVFAEKRRNV